MNRFILEPHQAVFKWMYTRFLVRVAAFACGVPCSQRAMNICITHSMDVSMIPDAGRGETLRKP